MKKILLTLLAMTVAGTIGLVGVSYAGEYAHSAIKDKNASIMKLYDLKAALRDLWVSHIYWVRNVAVATKYGDTEAAKVAEEKAVENAKAIAGAIEPYYGKTASDKLFGLLAGHYGAVKEYMTAAYAGDKAGKDAARDKLIKNADEIAVFLSGANPYLPKDTLTGLLYAHGGHHMAQLDALAEKNYANEARVWDEMKTHMYVVADALTGGLARQFPKKIR